MTTSTTGIDPRSTANASLSVDERTELLVVGAGPAGLSAAVAAAGLGMRVVLVDENPVPAATMGDDIPLHWGQRMSGAVRNRTAMIEALLESEPLLGAALEAGVDVRLGTACWGLYANGPSVHWLPGKVATLSDGERSTTLGFDKAIVATGQRDMGLAFDGWEQPGVMGAAAALRLLARYGALEARRVAVLGSGAEAAVLVAALTASGIAVAAVVEQAAAPLCPLPPAVPLYTRHVIQQARGGADGVTEAVLVPLDEDGRPIGGRAHAVACDTIALAVAAVPCIELTDAIGCRNAFFAARGGHVPVTDAAGETSVPGIYAVGDCAGTWPAKTFDRRIAEAEGRRAAAHAAGRAFDPAPPPEPDSGLAAYRLAWIAASVVHATGEPHVCQCEGVGARDILEVRPPRYLGWNRPGRNDADLASLLGQGPPNPDQLKRLTRAGMGVCQGRRCREQVAGLLALGGRVPLGDVPLATYRAPVRPLPLAVAGSIPETAEMTEHWDIWFGILRAGEIAAGRADG